LESLLSGLSVGQEAAMLIYLIIAAELVILYTFFWYVFLRTPSSFIIKGNPWGNYEQGVWKTLTTDGIDTNASVDRGASHQSHLLPRSKSDKHMKTLEYGWTVEEQTEHSQIC
jgi:hypothetical protein